MPGFCCRNTKRTVRIIPTFPFPPPDSALAKIAQGRLWDRPQKRLVNMVIKSPVRMTGLRPNVSLARPQATAVTHCARLKTALVIPAHLATLSLSTPKLSIISGCTVSVRPRTSRQSHDSMRFTYKVRIYRCGG